MLSDIMLSVVIAECRGAVILASIVTHF